MKPVKDKWDRALVAWQRKHIGQKLQKSPITKRIGQVSFKSVTSFKKKRVKNLELI